MMAEPQIKWTHDLFCDIMKITRSTENFTIINFALSTIHYH